MTPPLAPSSLSVTAKTMQKSATSPPVMKVFSPLITHSSPSRTAVVRMLRASEPAPGSVIAKQLIFSPSMVGRRYAACCSSLAWNRMLSASPPNRNCTNDRPSSISISALITAPSPIPPYSSGVWMPKNPAAFALSCSSRSSSSVSPRSLRRSRSRTVCSSGMISRVTNVRTQSRISRSSSVRLRSMTATLTGPPRRGPRRHSLHPCGGSEPRFRLPGVGVWDDAGMDPRDPERSAAGQTAIGEARRLSDRLTRLARVTTELARADSVETVTKIVITHSADAVGATIASLSVLEPGDVVHLVGLRGGEAHDAVQWERYPLATPTPSSDAIRTGERVMLMGEDALRERYAHVESIARGQRTVIALPMTSTGRRIGAIGLSFPGLRELDAAELEFFDILADTCAQAMVRIGAEEEARRQSARLLFLADASSELASSLDYQATLKSVAQLAVPNFADWCAIDLVDDGRLIRLAVEHVDPAKIRFAQEIAERWPSDPESRTGAWEVMRTGVSQLIPEVTEEMLLAAAMEPSSSA